MSYSLAVDIGGTFTDIAMVETGTGRLQTRKVPTTVRPEDGVIQGVEQLLSTSGVDPSHITFFIHATTLVTNAVIERRGGVTGLLTTAGFADTVDIGRESRYDLYDLSSRMPEPLVPRQMRAEVDERLLFDRVVERPLDRGNVLSVVAPLVAKGVQALAICFLHSYQDGRHERAAAEWVQDAWPELEVSISCDVCPEIGEFERMSTTLINAYTQPLTRSSLGELRRRLERLGIRSQLYLMLSSGGTTTATQAAAYPVRMIESGPAAAALAAAFTCPREANIVAFDMGGTTAKICLIHDGSPSKTYQFEVARVHRFKPGSGLPVKAPALDLLEIGAGGGSIAYVDGLGLLKVGPQSSGATPGPACYGFGGVEPTVTDAALLLGYLNPDRFLGGAMWLDRSKAETAIRERISAVLGIDAAAAAAGIIEVVNENMARAMQVHFAERGKDPRRYVLVATGGAAPLHAVSVGRKVGIAHLFFPPATGLASTLGLLASPVRVDEVVTVMCPLEAASWGTVVEAFATMRDRVQTFFDSLSLPQSDWSISRFIEVRYRGQGHTVAIPLTADDTEFSEELGVRFRQVYRTIFEHEVVSRMALEVINCRLTGQASGPAGRAGRRGVEGVAYRDVSARDVYLPGLNAVQRVAVYGRYALPTGSELLGPALIEDWETTIFIPDAASFVQEESGGIHVHLS